MPVPRKYSIAAFVAGMLIAAFVLWAEAGPAAGATPKYKLTHFKVEVKGVQKTTQTMHHKPENPCDISDNSTITEKVVFKTTPKLMTFYDGPGMVNPTVLADKPGKWKASASVTRVSNPRIIAPLPSPECGENDGGDPEVAPLTRDCGTKKVTDWEVELAFDERKKGALHVLGAEHDDPFQDCESPLGGLGFPFLILEDTKEKPIVADFPKDELFDPGIGKIIALGNGVQKYEEPDVSAKVSIEWDVSLTRVGGVKKN
jgi:hypothetical protein